MEAPTYEHDPKTVEMIHRSNAARAAGGIGEAALEEAMHDRAGTHPGTSPIPERDSEGDAQLTRPRAPRARRSMNRYTGGPVPGESEAEAGVVYFDDNESLSPEQQQLNTTRAAVIKERIAQQRRAAAEIEPEIGSRGWYERRMFSQITHSK